MTDRKCSRTTEVNQTVLTIGSLSDGRRRCGRGRCRTRPPRTRRVGLGIANAREKLDGAKQAAPENQQQRKDMAEAHLNLGISLFYLKNVDAAENELKTALATKGGEKLALAHLYLGQIYSQKKRNSEAVTELEKYLEMVPKAPNADRIKQAIEQLKKG